MEFWNETKDRAQMTLTVWTQYAPTLTIGGLGIADLTAYIAEFEPAAQARTTAQDAFDAAERVISDTLLKMKILDVKIAQIIDGQVNEPGIVRDLNQVFHIVPRSVPTIMARARALHPVWVRANAFLAALTPTQPPITRSIQGVPHTAAMLKGFLDGMTTPEQAVKDTGGELFKKRSDLRVIDRKTDRLIKDWYQVVKNQFEPGTQAYEALEQIPTEGGTPMPDAVDIATLTQGGTDGLHVLANYESGGGDHATTLEVQWMVVGVDADFTHTATLDPSGNTLGPFTVGQVVKVRTSVSNSSGTRTSAVRTITIETPIL